MIKELSLIQQKLKVPKSQRNEFGKYNYRSLEDITEGVKPLEVEHGVALTFSEELVTIGQQFLCKDVVDMGYEDKDGNWHPDVREVEVVKGLQVFIKSTATLHNASGEKESTSSFARHPENRKGQDDSQITGATTSYARKYAANALLCIDDTKDADATNTHGNDNPRRANGHTTRQRPQDAPKDTRPDTTTGESAKSQQETPEKPKEAPQGAPEKSPAEKMLDFMEKLGVKKSDMELTLAKDFDKFVESDFAFLRAVVGHMRKQKLSFEDAVELQCKIEADQKGEQK